MGVERGALTPVYPVRRTDDVSSVRVVVGRPPAWRRGLGLTLLGVELRRGKVNFY